MRNTYFCKLPGSHKGRGSIVRWLRPQVLGCSISGIKYHLCHSFTVWPWASCFISLSICKIRVRIILHRIVRTKEENTQVTWCTQHRDWQLSVLHKCQRINEVTFILTSLAWDYFWRWKKRDVNSIGQNPSPTPAPRLLSLHEVLNPVVHGVSGLINRPWLLWGRSRGVSVSMSPSTARWGCWPCHLVDWSLWGQSQELSLFMVSFLCIRDGGFRANGTSDTFSRP